MANLTESPIYEPGIFQLEKTTPPLGGAPAFNGTNPSAGHANVQGLQLANRTAWLKQQVEAAGSATQLRTDLQSDNGAAIVKYKLDSNAVNRSVFDKNSDWIDPRDYGAVSGSSEDVSPFLILAASAAKSKGVGLKLSGTYRLLNTVDLREIPLDMEGASFFLDSPSNIGLILGGNASQSWNVPQSVGRVFRTDESLTTPCVRIMGAKGQKIYIGRSHYIQLYASTSAPDRNRNYSIAYNTFTFGHVNLLELTTDPANASGPANSDTGGSIQWINENQFYLNRCHGLSILGSYTHNHNKFYSGTFEGPVTINMDVGFHNYLLNTRFEEGPTTIIFGPRSANCWIQKSWDGVIDDRQAALISGTINDQGTANVVDDDFARRHTISCVAFADINDPIVNNSVNVPARIPHLQRVGGNAGNNTIMFSDKIRIERNMQFYWAWTDANPGDTSLYRPYLEFFDKNSVPINALSSWVLTPGTVTVSGNLLSTGTGVNAESGYWATVVQSAIDGGAMFVRVGTRLSATQTANSLSRSLFIYGSLAHNSKYFSTVKNKSSEFTVVTSAPTQGFVPVGHQSVLNTGTTFYICTFAFESLTTSAAATGTTVLNVSATTGVAVGDRVGVNMDNRDTHWTTVSAVSTSSVTLTTGITSASSSGSRIVFNRQVTK